jgi:hypothetical protein
MTIIHPYINQQDHDRFENIMSEPHYGAFESNPARYTDTEAWVCQHDNVWRQMNAGEVLHHAAVLSEAQYQKSFPNLPALPKEAFKAS